MKRTLLPLLLALHVVLGTQASGCAGCSEQCGGANQGSAGCPCSSDQDCTTRLGEVLLCGTDGTCAPGDPEDAAAQDCASDAECGAGELCTADGVCALAPSCQRIDVEEVRVRTMLGAAVINPTEAGALTRDGCAHALVTPTLSVTLDAISPRDGAAVVAGQCSRGAWFAAAQAGVMVCGSMNDDVAIVAVGREPCFVGAASACATGTCEALGSADAITAGVCR